MNTPDAKESFVSLYDRPTDALRAAFAAANAPMYGSARPHKDARGMNGRTGYGWWTSAEAAEIITAGLRLTGYEVILLSGYSVGVIILDPTDANDGYTP